jgi:type VI secretion system (T6SS) effector TldE1-like protein
MWSFQQSSGNLTDPSGQVIGQGYSGHGPGVNNSAMQDVAMVGPIPQGEYLIGQPYTDPNKGPLVMRLMAFKDTNTYGRSGFLLHGDLVGEVGKDLASEGCIILAHAFRLAIASSGDTLLNVIP